MKFLVTSGLEELREGVHGEIAKMRSGVEVVKLPTLFDARKELANVRTPRADAIILDACTPTNSERKRVDYVYTVTAFLMDAHRHAWPPILVVCWRDSHFEYACESEVATPHIFATRYTAPADIAIRAVGLIADHTPQ